MHLVQTCPSLMPCFHLLIFSQLQWMTKVHCHGKRTSTPSKDGSNNPSAFLLWHSCLVISSVHILRTSWEFYSIVNVPSTLLSPGVCPHCYDLIYFLTHSPHCSANPPAAAIVLKGLDHFSFPRRNTTWLNHAPSQAQLQGHLQGHLQGRAA